MPAPALVAALTGPRDRIASSPLSGSAPGGAASGRSGPDAAGAHGRALAPLTANAVPAVPADGDSQFPVLGGGTDWLDLSAAAQSFLARFQAGSGADNVAGELLAGEVGSYLDAALEQLSAEIEKVFRLLGMSAADAGAAASGLAAPMAGQAQASLNAFHMESAAISASSEVTADGSRQSLSLVMQSIDIAVDRKTGTVTIIQQSLSVSVEVRTGDMVQAGPLLFDPTGNQVDLADLADRLLGRGADGRQEGFSDDPLRLRLSAIVPLGIDVANGRLIAGDQPGRGGQVAEALLDMTA